MCRYPSTGPQKRLKGNRSQLSFKVNPQNLSCQIIFVLLLTQIVLIFNANIIFLKKKMIKHQKMSLTSKQDTKHLLAGQNTQQLVKHYLEMPSCLHLQPCMVASACQLWLLVMKAFSTHPVKCYIFWLTNDLSTVL